MTDPAVEPEDVTAADKQLNLRMSGDDWKPLGEACENADIAYSVLIREALVRYGMKTLLELVAERAQGQEGRARTKYKIGGRRRHSREAVDETEVAPEPPSAEVPIAAAVATKFDVGEVVAKRWILLGQVLLDGKPVTTETITEDDVDRLTR